MSEGKKSRSLILFDGLCGLCHRLNRFIISNDRRGRFVFASLQGEVGKNILQKHGKDTDVLATFYVLPDFDNVNGELLDRSGAALFIADSLGWPWKLALAARILPSRWLDSGYDFVSRHRYRIWGKLDSCPVPDARYRERFVDESEKK
jgi:predicted DCC family thiol-disulfide oxidoreductase YuxK